MTYVSIDIETTGFTLETGHVLEFAAVFDDGHENLADCPNFSTLIYDGKIWGEAGALVMNAGIIAEIEKGIRLPIGGENKRPIRSQDLGYYFCEWLSVVCRIGQFDKITVAGKNFLAFDWAFLKDLKGFPQMRGPKPKIRHRVIDVGSMYLAEDDETIPDTQTCCLRAGINQMSNHRALDDALMVCQLVREGMISAVSTPLVPAVKY